MTWFRIKKKEIEQVRSGFSIVGKLFLAMLTSGFLIVGIGLIRFPETFQTWSWLHSYPLLCGCIFVLVSSLVFWRTMERWSKVLVWFFGTSAIRGFVSTLTGRSYSQPSRTIPRQDALVFAIELLLTAILMYSITTKKLRQLDYAAIMGVYFGFAWSVSSPQNSIQVFVGPAFGVCCLAIALLWRKLPSRWKHQVPHPGL